MTTGTGASAPAHERPGETPLYEQTAELWAAQGRTVPGRPDPEWDRLVGNSGGRRRRPVPEPRRRAA